MQNLPRGCRLIHFPKNADERGCLSFAEGQKHIPFPIERVFWIYDVPEGQKRGEHSHNECSEVIVPVSGSFDMEVDDGILQATVHMDSPETGILIPPSVWCRLQNFAPGTVCIVFASHPYNASGYTHNYDTFRRSVVQTIPYDASRAEEWNRLVADSKNATFLLDRRYMDYHADRFRDCSLLFYKKGTLIAALPSNFVEEEKAVYSHAGLTYGGLILSPAITAVEALEVFSCAIHFFRTRLGAKRWIYKPVPYIYHRLPAEEDLYALFLSGGKIQARAVSSVVDQQHRLPMRKLRQRGINKAAKAQITFCESSSYELFWPILAEVLQTKHGKKPVHTLEEIKRLHASFPDNIRLFLAQKNGKTLAGTVVYETETVAHAQYIASSKEGTEVGALDGLFDYLINERYSDKKWFDFGISTEQGGTYLNEGLVFQKEGFGARAVVYDQYVINLTESYEE
ncbi:MAG: GNAT family N-acetyltransferase [Bacteroidaceae bacterium]|nr:GNAT family N-acetyltransferase [Bacteroidaceae bacterium]